MTYRLEFKHSALKEWRSLDGSIQALFKKKLAERLENPRVESARLGGRPDRYKIKLKQAGYRLVYEVEEERITVVVVAVGKRERNAVYKAAAGRH